MARWWRVMLPLVLLLDGAAGLDNGLGLRPVMGFNTWYAYHCDLDQAELELAVKAMQASGLVALGYTYFDLDDCWAGGRHPNGSVYAQFPSGTLKPLADVVHQAGMRFGAYTCRADKTCASRPGSLGYETLDAETYAAWGVDLLKEDSCFTAGDNESLAIEQYSRMRDALNATGRPILFALCGWFPWYASEKFGAIGNMRRIGLDSNDWAAVLSNVDTNANLAAHAGPGAFNDPCLLISEDASGTALATELQTRAQFSLWAMMASPLLISGNVRNMSAFNLATYSNSLVIEVDQDVLGKQGARLAGGPLAAQAYLSACDPGDPAQQFESGGAADGTGGRIMSRAPGAAWSGVHAAPAAPDSRPACAFSAALNDTYLLGCPNAQPAAQGDAGGDCPGQQTLAAAEAACVAIGRACGGVTYQDASYQPRASNAAAPAPASRESTSWVVTNQRACRGPLPPPTPPPPPPPRTCFMARGCQSDPTFGPCAPVGGRPTCGGNALLPHPGQQYALDAHTAQLKSDPEPAAVATGCMDVSIFPYLMLKPCALAGAVPAAQQWSFDQVPGATHGTNTIRHAGSGACLTRGGLSTTNVWGRQLHGGDHALLFVNTGAVAADVTCGTACWAAAGLASGTTFAVHDLWKNASAGTVCTADPFTVHALQPSGGVAMFRLSPSAD